MSVKTLKAFQSDAVESGVKLFSHTNDLLNAVGDDLSGRVQAISHNGYLLIEAPTGSGKTLMAGQIVERFSFEADVVWFWFAPFKGVVGQTAGFLREQFQGIRVRELNEDRSGASSKRGDVFVTTWQTVATRAKDKRNVRKDSEANPSIDSLILELRGMGYRIGVVVDEAHHGFHGDTQAASFFHDVLSPDFCILVTATPKDADIEDFRKRIGVEDLHRIRIGRNEAVSAGLVKVGVKAAAYMVEPGKEKLVDLEATAIRDGIALHKRIKQTLQAENISLTPLLLIQVDSTPKSVDRAKERVLSLGFTEDQIATHTADEPDSGLLALANDEKREVLIFKMAVALGFDAPRACALVSMRASQDVDFGVQLVGRILRVHRRLQGRAAEGKLPDLLKYGFVFLADPSTQGGLDIAGQRMNAIQTEYAKISPSAVLVTVGGGTTVQIVDASGQTSMFPVPQFTDAKAGPGSGSEDISYALDFFTGAETYGTGVPKTSDGENPGQLALGPINYALRASAPRNFKTEVISPSSDVTEEDCARRFTVSAKQLLEALVGQVNVTRKTLEVFTHQLEFSMVTAKLDVHQAALAAQRVLLRSDMFDPRELRKALVAKLQVVMREAAMEESDDPTAAEKLLNLILATHPELLYEAQKAALVAGAQIADAEDIPSQISSETHLTTSHRNVYGVYPPDLNSWEYSFAQILDSDPNNAVLWWHRNLPHKPWSVNALLPDGSGFFPDFIIGVDGRKTQDHALLADTKFAYEIAKEIPKTKAVHGAYGRVLVIHRKGNAEWMTVRYDEKQRKPVLDLPFSTSLLATF